MSHTVYIKANITANSHFISSRYFKMAIYILDESGFIWRATKMRNPIRRKILKDFHLDY